MRAVFCSAVGVLLLSASAQAAVTYGFASSTTANTNFLVNPNATVQVPIYLRESGTAAEVSSGGIAAKGGLFSAGFAVGRSGTVPPNPSTATGATNNAAKFNEVVGTTPTPATSTGVWAEQGGSLFLTGANPDTSGLVLLGTVSLQAPSAGGQVTTFTISDYASNSAQFVTYNGTTPLDGLIAPATFTVTTQGVAIPEPAALGLAAFGGGLLLRRVRRSA